MRNASSEQRLARQITLGMNLNLVSSRWSESQPELGESNKMSNPEYAIPAELQETLLDFTVHYLVERPPDIIDFAMDYFSNLHSKRNASQHHHSEDESMESEDDIDFDEPVYNSAANRRKSVFAEAYNPEDDDGDDTKVVHPKTDEQRARLQERVQTCLLFRTLDVQQLAEVIDAMFEHKVKAEEMVIRQGDDGDYFYVIETGVYSALISTDAGPKKVFTYENEGNFGELALLYNMPRAASIKAETDGSLWAMDRQTFRKIVLKSAFQKRKMYESFLEDVSLLKHLEKYERENIADALISQAYTSGEKVVNQGDRANGMYFVESGTLVVLKGIDGDEKEVNELHQGEYFGELGLVNHMPRAATVAAKDDVRVAFLDVTAFERLLGPCMDIMKRNMEEYEEQLVKVFGSKAKISGF